MGPRSAPRVRRGQYAEPAPKARLEVSVGPRPGYARLRLSLPLISMTRRPRSRPLRKRMIGVRNGSAPFGGPCSVSLARPDASHWAGQPQRTAAPPMSIRPQPARANTGGHISPTDGRRLTRRPFCRTSLGRLHRLKQPTGQKVSARPHITQTRLFHSIGQNAPSQEAIHNAATRRKAGQEPSQLPAKQHVAFSPAPGHLGRQCPIIPGAGHLRKTQDSPRSPRGPARLC